LDPAIFLLVLQLLVLRYVWLVDFWQWMAAYMAKKILRNSLNVEKEILETTGQQRRTVATAKLIQRPLSTCKCSSIY